MIIPSTIREDIDQNSDQELSHRTFNGCVYLHYVKNGETIKIPLNHIINKYKEYFAPYIEKFDITEEDERKYLYSPKKLSLDVYKTTEYWSILLYINECHSIIDFAPTGSVNAIRPDILTKLLNEILILEGLV